jgi:hypothetical protein
LCAGLSRQLEEADRSQQVEVARVELDPFSCFGCADELSVEADD